VIRGQRNDEALKSPIRSGSVIGGVEYLFPIQNWSRAQVVQYLIKENVKLPRHYGSFDSSVDCLHCTGYLGENRGKMAWLEENHITAAKEVARRLRFIKSAVMVELTHISNALEEHA
jgi:phosphoadenosine phosphosulfate reductase